MLMQNQLAVVICTKDRPVELSDLLSSLARQTVLPHELLIVDAGNQSVDHVIGAYEPKLPIRYHAFQPPCLTRQRNFAIRHLSPDSTLVAFLDDDVILEAEAIEQMLDFWKHASDKVGGASFNITNYRLTKYPLLKAIFFLDGKERGKVLRSGVGTPYCPVTETQKVEWLCGGATVWRKCVFETHAFDEFYFELGWNEDLDFSYGVSKQYELMVIANARLEDRTSQTSKINNFYFGQMQSINRVYFARKYGAPFSMIACYWACLGQMLVNLLNGLLSFKAGLVIRSFGNAAGLLRTLTGKMSIGIS